MNEHNSHQTLIDDLSSSLLRNIAKTNTLEVAITKNKAAVEDVRSSASEMQLLLEENKRQLQRLNTIAFSIIFIVLIIITLLFINGMIVHYDTGIDERENQVLTNELLQ